MLSSHIVHRYLASVNPKTGRFYIDADVRFRPPTDMWEGVWKGEKDPKVLLIWKMCVEKIQGDGRTPSDKLYGAALAYWRNKIKKEGLDLPLPAEAKTIAETKYGPFQIKRGDDIDEWVKACLKSANLINDVTKTAAEWEVGINSLETAVKVAQERIAKHEKGLAEGTRVEQRKKWIAEAQDELENVTKDLDAARKAVTELQTTVIKHEEAKAPVIEFEQSFQLLLAQACNDLSKRDVLARAKAALAQFEASMKSPKMASDKHGLDLWDSMKALWSKLLNKVTAAFEAVSDWASDLMSTTKRLNKLLDSVS